MRKKLYINLFILMSVFILPVHAEVNQNTVVHNGFLDNLAYFLTNPIIVTILLSLASLGLVLELYSPGFGAFGTIGLVALILYFYSHLVTGMAGFDSIILFCIGVLLVMAEFFLPGAIAGFLGVIAIIGSLLMAGENVMYTAISICIALLITIIGMILMVKVFGKRMKLFKKIVLSDSVNTESGYVSNINRIDLLGLVGRTISPLRPAGTIDINGERLDVVTEGGYVDKGVDVRVIKVEGARIVVRMHHIVDK
jgi:membrane-bound serine protease (ClpP class)